MLRTLPDDDVRAILWRYADRYDLQMLVQSARGVARGPVARLVAAGGRNSHEWTPEKDELLKACDEAGLSAVGLDVEHGGFIEGPKNLALAIVAFELAWVDAGAATSNLANFLALGPIHERGTEQQRAFYMSAAAPVPGGEREPWRGAFALTEPIPYVGVETGLLGGKARVAVWEEGQEPILQIDKRGRFITGMGFADFVSAAVDSADERIKGSCMVILEKTDPGIFDRGVPARKLVHQLSSTRDPVFSLRVPASRIVGGYTVINGVIIPNFSHGEVIEAVFRRTRVTVGLMTAAKLLSAIEPVIRYHRGRFRGGEGIVPGSPRYEFGLQQKEDVLHRLVDIWATGEAAAALGFEAARVFDELDPIERQKDAFFAERGIDRGRAQMKALAKISKDALEYLAQSHRRPDQRNTERYDALAADPMVRFVLLDAVANVICPAVKLWNTGHGANVMREAVSLVGGYGITEDCPGFLGYKWMDSQLEATYEGPEAVQRRQLSITMTNELFLAQFGHWTTEMRQVASEHPGTGACTLATAMQLWLWTLVTFPLADALAWLLATRQQVLDVLNLMTRGWENPVVAEQLPTLAPFLMDLCHVQTARAAGEVGRISAELIFGYRRQPAPDGHGLSACDPADGFKSSEDVITGIAATAHIDGHVIEADGSHPVKAGPCAGTEGLEPFLRMRTKLDSCLAGARLAKDRAAEGLMRVMIPEALGYPL
ncbi:MAG: acyl-CoA/acyl-ACP dehydrogenase [Acidobacteria bacterium]|nr:acyl-CoA/acyl-ACP dehydrogenase [Acidobacteriota bacterium]